MQTKPTNDTFDIASSEFRKAALFFRAINHQLRIDILYLLHQHQKMIVGDIYRELKMEQSVTSQHLAVLRKAKLVHSLREGKKVYYSVNYDQVNKLQLFARELTKG